jgi:hypothetical protein
MAMKLLWSVVKTALVGLVTIAVVAFAVEWLVCAIMSLVEPLAHVISNTWRLSHYMARAIVVATAVAGVLDGRTLCEDEGRRLAAAGC